MKNVIFLILIFKKIENEYISRNNQILLLLIRWIFNFNFLRNYYSSRKILFAFWINILNNIFTYIIIKHHIFMQNKIFIDMKDFYERRFIFITLSSKYIL